MFTKVLRIQFLKPLRVITTRHVNVTPCIHQLNGIDTLRFIPAGDKVYSDTILILNYSHTY